MTVINTNVKALFSQASLRVNERALTGSMEQLSTGKRINSAKDDAAGLAIGMRMTADLRGIAVAIRNANDGISMMQTADGALGEVSNMLQRMRELAVQAATGSMSPSNRKALQAELDQLIAEVENVSKITNFNGIKLLDGSSAPVFLQTGTREGEQVQISIVDVKPKSLGLQGYAGDQLQRGSASGAGDRVQHAQRCRTNLQGVRKRRSEDQRYRDRRSWRG
jgi:flagellin